MVNRSNNCIKYCFSPTLCSTPYSCTPRNRGEHYFTVIAWYLSAKEQMAWDGLNDFIKFYEFLNKDEVQDYLKDPNKVNVTVSNLRIIENDGKAIFTVSIDKALENDLNLRLFTVKGSALEVEDYGKIGGEKNYIFTKIPAGTTSITQKVSIVRDGKTEGKEVFLLVAESSHYYGSDIENVTEIASGLGTIIDFPEDKCPQAIHKNFDLSFTLPSTQTYGVGGGFGGAGGAGGSAFWGIGSVPSISVPSKQPAPDIPYVECPSESDLYLMLVTRLKSELNSDLNVNLTGNRSMNFYKSLTSQAVNENDNSDSCSDGMCVPSRSEQNPGSGNKDKAGYAPNANNVNSKQSGAALNLSGTTDIDKSGNKLYFDMNSDGFKERMLDWFGQDEGVLVNDTNRNGIVDNGSEIIGNRYLNSKGETTLDTLSLLRDFDANKDGVIDSKDNSGLSVWIDKNRNAETDEGELISINDANSPIKSISLNYLDTLLSGYDRNHDMKIDKNDKIYDYIYVKNNDDNSINLYIYGDDRARAFLGDKTKDLTLQTDQGLKRAKEVIFYKDVKELNLNKQKPEYSDPRSIHLVSDAAPWDLNKVEYARNVELKEENSVLTEESFGNTLYTYKRGSGKVNIDDWNGIDTLKFGEGISRENLIIEKASGYIKIYVKDGIATKDEDLSKITDVITMSLGVNYAIAGDAPVAEAEGAVADKAGYSSADSHSRSKRAATAPIKTTGIIENIVLSNGNRLNLDFLYNGTDKSDLIVCGDDDCEINAGDGDDTIFVGSRNNTIDAGKGNDTVTMHFGWDVESSVNVFRFGRGDGKDFIKGFVGHKSRSFAEQFVNIEFKEGITANDIIIRRKHDLFTGALYEIALKEDGKSFEELSDKIYIRGGASLKSLKFQDGTRWGKEEINNAREDKVIHNSLNAFVLDLNNNDITSTSVSDASPKLDLNGEIKKSGWIEQGDGLLAMDLNKDGLVDPANELIGENLVDG